MNNLKLSDKEIEEQVSKNLFLAGRSVGKSYPYIYQAETLAKQHSQYDIKYKNSLSIIKSLYQVSIAVEKQKT